jgi:hypothetical protein
MVVDRCGRRSGGEWLGLGLQLQRRQVDEPLSSLEPQSRGEQSQLVELDTHCSGDCDACRFVAVTVAALAAAASVCLSASCSASPPPLDQIIETSTAQNQPQANQCKQHATTTGEAAMMMSARLCMCQQRMQLLLTRRGTNTGRWQLSIVTVRVQPLVAA